MNAFHALRDTWFFFSTHLVSIARLCLPLVFLETLVQYQVSEALGNDSNAPHGLLVGLFFYPLYTGALILFLNARSSGGEMPSDRELLARSLQLWPRFAILAGATTLATLAGVYLYVLPGIWIMIKLAFADYLLVLRGVTPLRALYQSFTLTSGFFWPILLCVLCVMLPVWGFELWRVQGDGSEPNALAELLFGTIGRFFQLFSTVVLFRLFMLRDALPQRA
ncbi:hypothetical protein [Pseudomonas sp. GD03944]|uniref:hypothetical protein n=1 Tax=Pseudomonas sp. GD03944 TaxID=2975409 RepID=UPI00244C9751|nr:hypothetical protein [Pseudomonas sp. GD03944]MDH1262445.1 hypothetical protein [Pseudomonas sp. GD03944]